jgi:hypothetical protein
MQELSISSPSPPEAQFVVRPPNPTVNDTVELDASVSDDQDQDIQSYTWNVGDGRTMTGERVTLKYDDPLQYQILLTVEDSTGRSDTVMQSLAVDESEDVTTDPIDDPNTDNTDQSGSSDTTDGTDSTGDSTDSTDTGDTNDTSSDEDSADDTSTDNGSTDSIDGNTNGSTSE